MIKRFEETSSLEDGPNSGRLQTSVAFMNDTDTQSASPPHGECNECAISWRNENFQGSVWRFLRIIL